jgi:hypothetical protein
MPSINNLNDQKDKNIESSHTLCLLESVIKKKNKKPKKTNHMDNSCYT